MSHCSVDTVPNPYMSTREVSTLLGVSPTTVRRVVTDPANRIRCVTFGGSRRINRQDLTDYLRRNSNSQALEEAVPWM